MKEFLRYSVDEVKNGTSGGLSSLSWVPFTWTKKKQPQYLHFNCHTDELQSIMENNMLQKS